MLDKIFQDPFQYYGGTYNIITSPTPLAIGDGRYLAYAITAYNEESESALPEIYIKVKDVVESKVEVFNDTIGRIKQMIRQDYAGKELSPEDCIKYKFSDNFLFGLIFWTWASHNDVVNTFDNEDVMIDNIKVIKKLNPNSRFRCFKKEKDIVEYFPNIYD